MRANFVHVCARCAIQNGVACTSEEIKMWMLLDFKSDEDKVEFKKGLMKKRTTFSYAENEYAGYSGCYPPYGKYIENRFSQGKKMAEEIAGSIVLEGFIAQKNAPFRVNLQLIEATYGYVPAGVSRPKDNSRIQNAATPITFPSPSMSIPPPGMMNVPPPNLIKGIECFQNTPPTFRKEGKVSLSAGETRGSMRDSTRSRNGDAKRSTVEFLDLSTDETRRT